MKQMIAYQISTEELAKWKSRGAAFWKEAEESLPVFWEKQPEQIYRPDAKESP